MLRYLAPAFSSLLFVAGVATIFTANPVESASTPLRFAEVDTITTGSIRPSQSEPVPTGTFRGTWALTTLAGARCQLVLTSEPTAHGRRLEGGAGCAMLHAPLAAVRSWREEMGGIVMLDAAGTPVAEWMVSEAGGLDMDGPHGLFVSMRPQGAN